MAKKHSYRKRGSNPWERKMRHHKWADEREADEKAKAAKKAAKQAAKDEDHTKKCPYCDEGPVEPCQYFANTNFPTDENTYLCQRCGRIYLVNCPGTILLDGDPVIVEQ